MGATFLHTLLGAPHLLLHPEHQGASQAIEHADAALQLWTVLLHVPFLELRSDNFLNYRHNLKHLSGSHVLGAHPGEVGGERRVRGLQHAVWGLQRHGRRVDEEQA